MKIVTSTNLPTGLPTRRRYGSLVESLRSSGGWVAVQASEIAGSTRGQKQTTVLAACHRANLRVETRTTTTELFIRNLKPAEVEDAIDDHKKPGMMGRPACGLVLAK